MKSRGRLLLLTGILLFSFMLLSLQMMSMALEDSDRFGNLYSYLLVFNTLGLITLVTLIVLNFRRLARELRNRVPGSVMTVRMVVMFSILSITPVLVLYYFSLDFLLRGIDNWFDLRVEQALDDSLELSRLALDGRMRELLKQTTQIAEELKDTSDAASPFEIDEMRSRSAAEELTLLTRQGSIIASSTGEGLSLVPDRPNETILLQLQQGSSYVGLDPVKDTGLYIRVVVNVPEFGTDSSRRIIQALFPVTERMNELAASVQSAFVDYKELSYLREQLKLSFIMILTLVLLFSIFSVVWAAFYSAKKLAAPVRDLAEGTRAVAEGDYTKQLPVTSRDELGFLVASFNSMTEKISNARDAVHRSKQEAESQRAHLETVLTRLSSGVMVIGNGQIIQTANYSAGQILDLATDSLLNRSLEQIRSRNSYLEPLTDLIAENILDDQKDFREQITIFGTSGRQVLMCSGAKLPDLNESSQGYVIVFDDITVLLQGQKDAAWSEVARRLAHEIKNPLTPIQLAAERLRHKYLRTMQAEDSETLDRLTNTIVQQVETMKDMVNSFSNYARPPTLESEPASINDLIIEVTDLYSNDDTVSIETILSEQLPLVDIDTKRMRQVFNNLIKNAIDASPEQSTLEVSTQKVIDRNVDSVEIRIRDSGYGIADNIKEQLFDPYVTNKTKGTGLGLAISKRIVEEHGGMIWLENNTPAPGACVYIRLPLGQSAIMSESGVSESA
ncbi:MAG: ATP-binding protein [Thiotrichales bacterium]|nr:ATP-binding protein [Thiotrichales bacterium]